MDERTFMSRTKQFYLKVTRLMGNLPRAVAADVMARQLLPYANSIGANYRAACKDSLQPMFWRSWLSLRRDGRGAFLVGVIQRSPHLSFCRRISK
jgi:hypothetical protein